jgi:transcriptional regulator with XRE-family HTH domain
MSVRITFASNLKRLRLQRKMSQETLALLADVERAYIGLLERQKSSPTIDMVEKIAIVLKVRPDELLKPHGNR